MHDVFVSKLDNSLSLIDTMLFGGDFTDQSYGIAIFESDVFVAGSTDSVVFTGAVGSNDAVDRMAFVTKIDKQFSSIKTTTFGDNVENRWEDVSLSDIALDNSGNVFVAGRTTTHSGYDPVMIADGGTFGTGGSYDVLVAKLDSSLNLLGAYYIGSEESEWATAIDVDNKGRVFIVGSSVSPKFPTTAGAYDQTFNGGYDDTFVAKFDNSLTLMASTFIGGSEVDNGLDITIDNSEHGNIFISGYTDSPDFPIHPETIAYPWHGGFFDVFVLKLDNDLSSQPTAIIEFDRLEYPSSVNPIITVTDVTADNDPAVVDFVSVHVSSSSDLGGIDVTLRETGTNTGIFSGNVILTLTDESSGNRLRVSNCDIIHATYKNSADEATVGTDCNKGVDVNEKIVFQSDRNGNTDIYVINADGSGETRLTDNSFRDWVPCWSPDGTKIAFVSGRNGNDEIYVMNADGSAQTRLTDNSFRDLAPCWSPDGTKIAFVSDRDGNDEIYVMNADGSGQTFLTQNPAKDGYPNWSPDGTKIAFQSNRNGNTDIYVMNADGSAQTFLTQDPAKDEYPDWSPDGTKIAFQTSRAPNSKSTIHVMNADGSDPTRLGNERQDAFPSWSPDGTKIAFATFRDFNTEIYVMNADGSDQTRLTNNLAQDTAPDWQAFGVSSQPQLQIIIPSWIKINAGWWAIGEINDNSFVEGIKYLIKEGIMRIPETEAGTTTSQEIPTWIKQNAGWWSEGQISDESFVNGIQWLIENGIMKIG